MLLAGSAKAAAWHWHMPRPCRLALHSTQGPATVATWAVARRKARLHRGPACCQAQQQAAAAPPAASANATLEWLTTQRGATPTNLRVRRVFLGDALGWGVVATEDIEPNEVLLSVPLTEAITSEGVGESRWSVHMALQLLEHAALGEASPIRPWLEALPQHVPLPWLYYSEEELAAIQDEDALQECRQLRGIFRAACEEAGGAHSPEQVAWALSVVHSRSFISGGCHVFVPGIDFCNHQPAPTAGVRCVHPLSQGATAEEEVCPPSPPEPSRFELVAGEDGIRAGEEVTISYGSWPYDVLLLFFGFVPGTDSDPQQASGTGGGAGGDSSSRVGEDSVSSSGSGSSSGNNSVVLFSGLQELALCYHAQALWASMQAQGWPPGGEAEAEAQWEAAIYSPEVQQQVLELWKDAAMSGALHLGEDYSRLVVTPSGFDSRLLPATSALVDLYPRIFLGNASSAAASESQSAAENGAQGIGGSGSAAAPAAAAWQPPAAQDFLRQRCEELLEAYPTTWEEDAAWLRSQLGAQASENMRTAVRFRMSKKAVLRAALSQL